VVFRVVHLSEVVGDYAVSGVADWTCVAVVEHFKVLLQPVDLAEAFTAYRALKL
jgi:hypothetical protein